MLALIYENTKCDNDLYGYEPCHMERVEFALVELEPDRFGDHMHLAHLCAYHALPVLIENEEGNANYV